MLRCGSGCDLYSWRVGQPRCMNDCWAQIHLINGYAYGLIAGQPGMAMIWNQALSQPFPPPKRKAQQLLTEITKSAVSRKFYSMKTPTTIPMPSEEYVAPFDNNFLISSFSGQAGVEFTAWLNWSYLTIEEVGLNSMEKSKTLILFEAVAESWKSESQKLFLNSKKLWQRPDLRRSSHYIKFCESDGMGREVWWLVYLIAIFKSWSKTAFLPFCKVNKDPKWRIGWWRHELEEK